MIYLKRIILVKVLQRNRIYINGKERRAEERRGRERLIYYTEWVTWLWSLTSPKICRVSQQTGDSGKPMVWFQSKGQESWHPRRATVSVRIHKWQKLISQFKGNQAGRIFYPLGEGQPVLFCSADCMRFTYIRVGTLFFSMWI